MEKYLSLKFLGLLSFLAILFVTHEYGHYLAYRVLGYKAVIRKSFLAPGIDPKQTIEVSRLEGLIIALGGFVLSTIIVVVPLMLVQYKLLIALMIGSIAGSIVDFIWALSMLFRRNITIPGK